MTKETLRMQMLSGVITEGEYKAKLKKLNSAKTKDSLNEVYVAGGIVGVGAINNPFEGRKKETYEDAFEHFLGQKYGLNEGEDDMPEAPSHEETDTNQVYEGDLNENTIDQMIAGIKGAFDSIRSLPLPGDTKFEMAKTGVGLATLNAISQKLAASQNVSPGGQARLQKAVEAIKQATSIEEIEQALIDAVTDYASTNN